MAYLAYAFPYRNRHRDTGNWLYTVPIYLSHLRASEYISAVYYLLIVCFLFHLSMAPSRSPRLRSRAFAYCACSYYVWIGFISACRIRLQPRQRTFFSRSVYVALNLFTTFASPWYCKDTTVCRICNRYTT